MRKRKGERRLGDPEVDCRRGPKLSVVAETPRRTIRSDGMDEGEVSSKGGRRDGEDERS